MSGKGSIFLEKGTGFSGTWAWFSWSEFSDARTGKWFKGTCKGFIGI